MWRTENTFLKLCCLIFWLGSVQFLFAQDVSNIHFERVQGEGLSDYYIKCIQQDANGFIWFGTSEGLFRYDGYSFKSFKNFPGDPHTLINDNFEFLFPDNKLLWGGTWGGLTSIDINTGNVKNFPSNEVFKVYSIVPQNDSIFWIGTSTGLFEFNKKMDTWKRIPEINKNIVIRSLCYDGKKNLIITAHDGFYNFNTTEKTCKHYLLPLSPVEKHSMQVVHRSLLDKDGNIWMTTWAWGLVQFNPQTEKIKEWVRENIHDKKPYKTAFDMLQNNDGNIWIANQDAGLTILNTKTDSFINYPLEWDNEKKLSDAVYSLFRDRSGIVWIGTENGIYKYDPHIIHLSKIDFLWKMDTGLVRTQLFPICMLKDRDGLWWIGTYEGLFLLDVTSGILDNYNNKAGIPNATTVANILQDANGTLWISAGNKLFQVIKRKKTHGFLLESKAFTSPSIRGMIYKMYIDHENQLWIGAQSNGVFRFDASSKKFIAYPFNDSLSPGYLGQVRGLCEISKDSLLVAGEYSGVWLLHTNSGRYEKIIWNGKEGKTGSGMTINEILKKDQMIWLATDNNGLWQTNDQLKKFTPYTIRDGLPSMNISSIMIDRRNHLWLLTEGGVVDFQPLNNQVKVYDKKEGIRNSTYLSCQEEDEDGNIAIGDMGCIHFLNPFEIIRNNEPPGIFINGFKISNRDYPFGGNGDIRLKYTQNYFSFEYTALNYTQPSLNRYAYKLEGLDKQWNDAGNRRYISYAGLPEGAYTFKVKAANNEGVWNNNPATVTFTIEPPFWHRLWFYSLIIVFVAGVIYSLYTMRINQWKIRHQLRNKIARDLHDDIGSTLSGITIFSKIALQKIRTEESGSKELLQKISERSEKTMDALSDIVWSINTKNDDVENVIAKMQEYLSEVLEPQGIRYEFMVDEGTHHLHLGMDIRKELYLIFKEAIHNACKYSHCSCVNISLTRKKEASILSIRDNGKGFDVNKDSLGNGIHNMKQRAEKINASISIESEINKGTSITLRFPVT